MVEIAQADPLQRTDQAQRVIWSLRTIDERAEHRQHHEGKRRRARRLGLDMARGDAGLDHHQRELADLRQIDRRQQAGAQALLHQIQRQERRDARGSPR